MLAILFVRSVREGLADAGVSLLSLFHYACRTEDLVGVLFASLVIPLLCGNLLVILACRQTWLRALAVLGAVLSIAVEIILMACAQCSGENDLMLLGIGLIVCVLVPLLVLSSSVLVVGTTIQLGLLRRHSRQEADRSASKA
jgi:hypothetical protein